MHDEVTGIAYLKKTCEDEQTTNSLAKTAAWLKLGECAYHGKHLPPNYDLAISYFKKNYK